MKFNDAKIELIRLSAIDVITGSDPVQGPNELPPVKSFSIGK